MDDITQSQNKDNNKPQALNPKLKESIEQVESPLSPGPYTSPMIKKDLDEFIRDSFMEKVRSDSFLDAT
jgi:hypothetical protein